MILQIDEKIRLELTSERHANALFRVVDNNRGHLSEFLPWVGSMQSVEDMRNYLKNCEWQYQQGKEMSFVIIFEETLVGRIGLNHINRENKNAAIGYWLAKNAVRKGIIFKSCNALLTFGFQELGLHRIEIKAAVSNVRSQSIPLKLNFSKEGILRQAEWVNNKFLDLVLYSLLSNEWIGETTKS